MSAPDFDHCPTCGRRIKDFDMTGREDESGQRHCVVHPLERIEWVDAEAGEIIDEQTLAAIEAGEYFPSQNPTYRRLNSGDIEITQDAGGWGDPGRRIVTIYRRDVPEASER